MSQKQQTQSQQSQDQHQETHTLDCQLHYRAFMIYGCICHTSDLSHAGQNEEATQSNLCSYTNEICPLQSQLEAAIGKPASQLSQLQIEHEFVHEVASFATSTQVTQESPDTSTINKDDDDTTIVDEPIYSQNIANIAFSRLEALSDFTVESSSECVVHERLTHNNTQANLDTTRDSIDVTITGTSKYFTHENANDNTNS